MGQIWDFFRSDSVHFGAPRLNVLNLIWKNPGFVPFGANLTHFGVKFVHPDPCLPLNNYVTQSYLFLKHLHSLIDSVNCASISIISLHIIKVRVFLCWLCNFVRTPSLSLKLGGVGQQSEDDSKHAAADWAGTSWRQHWVFSISWSIVYLTVNKTTTQCSIFTL